LRNKNEKSLETLGTQSFSIDGSPIERCTALSSVKQVSKYVLHSAQKPAMSAQSATATNDTITNNFKTANGQKQISSVHEKETSYGKKRRVRFARSFNSGHWKISGSKLKSNAN